MGVGAGKTSVIGVDANPRVSYYDHLSKQENKVFISIVDES